MLDRDAGARIIDAALVEAESLWGDSDDWNAEQHTVIAAVGQAFVTMSIKCLHDIATGANTETHSDGLGNN